MIYPGDGQMSCGEAYVKAGRIGCHFAERASMYIGVYQNYGGPVWVHMMRILVFGDLDWGPPMQGNYHIVKTLSPNRLIP